WSTNAEVLRLKPAGESCDATFQCASGFCVEGLCCDRACDGCRTCTLAGGATADGVCTPPSCAGYTLSPASVARPTPTRLVECARSADCAAGFVCEPDAHDCVEPGSAFVDEGCAFSPPDRAPRGSLALLFAAAVVSLGAARRRAASRGLHLAVAAPLSVLLAG